MAGNVAECQKTWTCMKEHVSNNILEGNEPASIYSIATVGYNMERTIDDATCECFIVGVQNDVMFFSLIYIYLLTLNS